MKKFLRLLSAGAILLMPLLAHAQPNPAAGNTLQARMATIATTVTGTVGATILFPETGEMISLHGDQHFPMQSVYKFPIAMALLHQVDAGALTLRKMVRIGRSDLLTPRIHSPIRDAYPNGGISLSIRELLRFAVSESDGVASDILLRLLGGPESADTYIRSLGIEGIAIATTEREMAADSMAQYRSWCRPEAMARLLDLFRAGRGLSNSSHRLLSSLMKGTTTGPKRIKGLLPPGTIVEHKTGTDRTIGDMTRATNDAGIITLPDGRKIVVAVFISDSRSDEKAREGVIAAIAKAAWDYAISAR